MGDLTQEVLEILFEISDLLGTRPLRVGVPVVGAWYPQA